MNTRGHIGSYALIAIAGFAALLCSCGDFFANQTASLGGDIAGTRGTVRVLFINNTAHRAVFTYGTYDENNTSFVPDFAQFSLEGGMMLDAGQASSVAAANADASLDCARVFSIGSPELLSLIRNNVPDDQLDDIDEEAMLEGVEFFSIPDEDADGEDNDADEDADGEDEEDTEDDGSNGVTATEPASQGIALPFEALLGVDFACNGLLIIRFEIDDVSDETPFRIDFEVIPSESNR
ncbi:MAG: hypothetical protein ACYTFA_11180 [Planctomycetota bacterium]|jgi:hypothetical protein